MIARARACDNACDNTYAYAYVYACMLVMIISNNILELLFIRVAALMICDKYRILKIDLLMLCLCLCL